MLGLVTQLRPSLCDPMDYSLPAFSVHGISPERILEWVAISFTRGSNSHTGEQFFFLTTESPGKPLLSFHFQIICLCKLGFL